jgi:hypothetical protein
MRKRGNRREEWWGWRGMDEASDRETHRDRDGDRHRQREIQEGDTGESHSGG